MAPTFSQVEHRQIITTDTMHSDKELIQKEEQLRAKQNGLDSTHNNMSNETYSFKLSDIKWRNVVSLSLVHVLAFYGLYLYVTGAMKWQTAAVAYVFGVFSAFGITTGAHRLWAHRSYKAKWPLR